MNKTELIAAVAASTRTSKKAADAAVNAVLDAIADALKQGDSVMLLDFGTFEVRHRGERTARNPRNGEPVRLPAAAVPAFKAGKRLKEKIAED